VSSSRFIYANGFPSAPAAVRQVLGQALVEGIDGASVIGGGQLVGGDTCDIDFKVDDGDVAWVMGEMSARLLAQGFVVHARIDPTNGHGYMGLKSQEKE
jgi:hypothetical protein